MEANKYTIQKVLKIFGADVSRQAVIEAENTGLIPAASREGSILNGSAGVVPSIWGSSELLSGDSFVHSRPNNDMVNHSSRRY